MNSAEGDTKTCYGIHQRHLVANNVRSPPHRCLSMNVFVEIVIQTEFKFKCYDKRHSKFVKNVFILNLIPHQQNTLNKPLTSRQDGLQIIHHTVKNAMRDHRFKRMKF